MTSKTFFTSDVHFGHINIIPYCGRPFADVPEMNAAIVELWNETVGPHDSVVILGDLCMGKLDDSLSLAGQLNGYKVLLPGNHDRCHPNFSGKKGQVYWVERYRNEAGITDLLDLTTRITIGHHKSVLVSHFPYEGDHEGQEDRYVDLRPKDTGEVLVHGHVHDAWRQRGRMFNVGLDAWGGRLLPEEELEALIDGDLTAHSSRVEWA